VDFVGFAYCTLYEGVHPFGEKKRSGLGTRAWDDQRELEEIRLTF